MVAEKYRNDRPEIKERVWSQIPEWLKLPEEELYKISNYGRRGSQFSYLFGVFSGVVELQCGVKIQRLFTTPSSIIHWTARYQKSFDFAASFSSIEHSGLGRYGDPIDPIGDLREVWKTSCLLKKGGERSIDTG
ncbi:hypothetical protein GCK32_017207, partial [Trichostrongylus colubriformis]